MKKSIVLITAVLIIAMTSIATANTVTSLYGDKDGFGIGVLPDQGFDWGSVIQGAGDPSNTDIWMYGTQSWVHSYSLSGLGAITGAAFEIMTGGQGLGELSNLYINSQFVGTLTDGDDTGPMYNYARLDVFNLMPFVSYLTGTDTIQVVTSGGDGWVLDYSQITLSDNATTVPEPTTMLLLGLGLMGLARVRRKLKK